MESILAVTLIGLSLQWLQVSAVLQFTKEVHGSARVYETELPKEATYVAYNNRAVWVFNFEHIMFLITIHYYKHTGWLFHAIHTLCKNKVVKLTLFKLATLLENYLKNVWATLTCHLGGRPLVNSLMEQSNRIPTHRYQYYTATA